MKSLLVIIGLGLLMASNSTRAQRQVSQNSQESKKSAADVLERVAIAHGKEKLARADMVAEGTVTVYNEQRPTVLNVTLLRNGEHESQRILLQLAGKPWDGRGESLTPEGKRALDFLETQYVRGPRQLLKTSAGSIGVTSSATLQELMLQEDDGGAISYFLDSTTSRLVHFEFEQGQYRDSKGQVRPTVHSYDYSDYRSTDGIATPYRVEHDANGARQEELQLNVVRYTPATIARKQ
jgi:hypothetical protein